MTRTYLFQGDFIPFVKGRVSHGLVYDEYSQAKIKFSNSIEDQHGSERKFQGRLNLSLLLRLPFPDGISKRKQEEKDMLYYTNRPTISVFLRALEELLAGVVITDSGIIVAVEAEKRMSLNPCVQFTLTEIE